MKNQFFSAKPEEGYKERDRQAEIFADYDIVYKAMGVGHDDDRAYLAKKYNRKIETVGDLNTLGQDLFSQLNNDSREADKYLTERNLNAINDALEDGPDHD
jgi:hypothetical protein